MSQMDPERGEPRADISRSDSGRFSLGELTEAAGVSVRTVRYYIAEGLLPPPVGAGAGSGYTAGHLNRLRLIGRLKAAYLPLKEIRRQLAGLDDADVRRALDDLGAMALDAAGEMPEEESASGEETVARAPAQVSVLDSAAAYVASVLRGQAAGGLGQPGAPASPAVSGRPGTLHPRNPPSIRAAGPPPDTETGTWRRIPLGEDAELLVREDAYRRKRDRVEWLVRWARNVFE